MLNFEQKLARDKSFYGSAEAQRDAGDDDDDEDDGDAGDDDDDDGAAASVAVRGELGNVLNVMTTASTRLSIVVEQQLARHSRRPRERRVDTLSCRSLSSLSIFHLAGNPKGRDRF